MPINEQQLRKQLNIKKKEMNELQHSIDRVKYQKQLEAFISVFKDSTKLIDLIKVMNMNADDTRIFAEKINTNLNPICKNFEADIMKNQQKRAHSNALRKQRRVEKTDATRKDFVDELFSSITSGTVDASPDVSTDNTTVTSVPERGAVVRQY